MSELNIVVDYLSGKAPVLQVFYLSQKDRTMVSIINNRLREAIDVANPAYKTMADLMKETLEVVGEMRADIERNVSTNYSKVHIMEEFLFLHVLAELGRRDLDDEHSCLMYLSDLAMASTVSIQFNEDMESTAKLFFESILYLAVIAMNLIYAVMDEPPLVEGVAISFDRRGASAV